MGIFSKPEYKEVVFPFLYSFNEGDYDGGILTIEAHGEILGEYKYCSACFLVKSKYLDQYDEMSDLLINDPQKLVKVVFRIKDGRVKDFKIDSNSLADAYKDDRFRAMETAGWGMFDKSRMAVVFDRPDLKR